MTRDLDQPILRLNGEPFPDDLKLGTAIFLAVTAPLSGDEQTDGTAKMRLYSIASKVHAGGKVDLTAEEVSLAKDRIGHMFTVEVVGCAYALLEAD